MNIKNKQFCSTREPQGLSTSDINGILN
jgi:hypothetical protein